MFQRILFARKFHFLPVQKLLQMICLRFFFSGNFICLPFLFPLVHIVYGVGTLCGLLEPVSGKICRNGRPANARERLRSSFLVMQDVNYQLFSDSVREEVLLGAAHPERCDAVLQALGLDGLADRHPMSLSGGQKQRVVVAAAMLSDKPLILLDEPTSGLDLGSMQQVGQLLQEWKAQGKTLLVITHDEELAANWCDRVIRWDDTEGV